MKKHFLLLLMAFFSLTGWALDISNFNVTIQGTGAWEYTGVAQAAIVLDVKMPNATDALDEGVDYKVVYYNANNQEIEIANVINAGTYYVAARGIGDNEGETQKLLFEVAPKSIATFTAVLPNETFDYDGQPKTFQGNVGLKWVKTPADPPAEEVAVNLVKGTDFDFTYENNSEVGQAKVVYTGKGNYKGTLKEAFTINKGTLPTDLTKYTFAALAKNPVYSGSAVTTIPTITINNVAAKDFTIRWKKGDNWVTAGAGTQDDPTTYPNPTDAGTYTAYVYGTGNYNPGDGITGANPAWTLTIEKAPLQVYVDEMKKTYDGYAIATTGTPAVITGATIKFTGWKGNDSQVAGITDGVTAQFAEGVTNAAKVGTYNMVPVVADDADINNNYEVNPITTAYTIEKRTVFVAAKEQKFKFTGAAQNLNTTVSATTVEIVAADNTAKTGLVGEDKLETIKNYIQISLKEGVTIQAKENTAYTGAILITETAPENAAGINYTISGIAGNVVMESEKMVFIPANVEKPYGYTINPGDFKLVKTTSETIEGAEFAITDADNKVWTATDGVLPIGTYTIAVTNAEAITPANYDFNPDFVYTGELTITKKAITPNIKTQVVAKGSGLVTTVDMVDFGDQLVDENDKIAWTLAFNTGLEEGQIGDDQIAEGKIIAGATDATYAKGIKISEPATVDATVYANAKYAIDWSATGKLIVGAGAGAGHTLELEDNADAAAQIIASAGETFDEVTIKFAARNEHRGYSTTATETYPWKAEKWTTMVLPFDISVADLSKALGYAIVNVINPEKSEVSGTGSKFYGMLTMTGGNGKDDVLVANKPFMLKLAEDLDPDENYKFGQRTIVAPSDLSVDADKAKTVKFTGTYAAKTVTKADNAAIWFMNGNEDGWQYIGNTSSTWTIAPFEAYIDMSSVPAGARSITFNFEDIDGTVTAIKSINAENLNKNMSREGWYNLNGVKLQGAPTQKGIYIQNGKKVVVK